MHFQFILTIWCVLCSVPPFAACHPPSCRKSLDIFLPGSQISRALLGDDQRLKLPRFLEEDQIKDPEATKQDLIEKIAQLNSSIDEVAAQLKTRETVEGESVAA